MFDDIKFEYDNWFNIKPDVRKQNQNWTINGHVLQYSSYLLILSESQLQIESLVMFSYEIENLNDIKQNIKCFTNNFDAILSLDSIEQMQISLMPIDKTTKSLWKIKCLMNYSSSIYSIGVAIVDKRDFTSNTKILNNSIYSL